MEARLLIAKLRDGNTLSKQECVWFANGLADGTVTDAQAGAFAMAVFLNGLGGEGRVALTQAMRDSGDVLEWGLPGPVLDKHSTGGIGDSVSLLLAPALAACGAYVPMISGRGLGHTGGTLDKLEAIDGYNVDVSEERLHRIVRENGCAIVGATGRIAPADKRLYLVRDITGTVESIDLITASILSKKLAAGLEGLILDVKCGSGAFMKSPEDAMSLAQSLVDTASGAGCPTRALLTEMDQPLARTAGNALEVAEVLRVLTGHGESPRLMDLTVALGGNLLHLGGLSETADEGCAKIEKSFASGEAAERFGRMVSLLGGSNDVLKNGLAGLAEAPVVLEVPAPRTGWLDRCNAEALGRVVVALGGGRLRDSDKIDPAVGLSDFLPLGTKVAEGDPIARVHAARETAASAAVASVQEAYAISDSPPEALPLIFEEVG